MKAIVTGASRGVGRGIAIALAKQGYDLHVTGRSRGHLDALVREVAALGRRCITLPCDHADFASTVETFEALGDIRFDIVVNNAWGGYEQMVEGDQFTWEKKFWEQPDHRWISMMDVGVRTAFLCSRHCVKPMIAAGHGLIVNISFWAARRYMQNVIYGMSKAAIDKMTSDMAEELSGHGVTVVSLYPGLVRTEAVLANAAYFDLTNSESPEFQGLVIAALARDPAGLRKTGQFHTSAGLAAEYDIVDIDGKRFREERLT